MFVFKNENAELNSDHTEWSASELKMQNENAELVIQIILNIFDIIT